MEESYQNLIQFFDDYKKSEKTDDLKENLSIIISNSKHFHRNHDFWGK